MEPSGSVDHDHIDAGLDPLGQGVEGDRGRISAFGPANNLDPDTGAPGLELIGSRGAESVSRCQQNRVPLSHQHP